VDLLCLAGLAVGLGIFFLRPTFQKGWGFGVGPDVSVYLWWARVGASQGLSVVADRPGIATLIPVVAGTLHMPLVPVVAGLQYAMASLLGVAATAVLHGRARGGRWGWMLAGVLAGLFAVHLAGGYVANLAFTLPFFAAGAALAKRSRRGTDAAALLLGGGGLTHPQFFLVGAVIVVAVVVWSWLREPEHGWTSDAGRGAVALAGAGAIVGAGVLAVQVGPAYLAADTSKDASLRRLGLTDALHRVYVHRFLDNVSRYAPWVLLPLAAAGVHRTHRFTRRFLVAWAVITLLGVPLGIATGWFPPDRVITFAFALPVLAALGVTWVWDALARIVGAWLAWPVAVVLVGVMAAGAAVAWQEQETFISPDVIYSSTMAGRIAATLPPDTPLVFIVNEKNSKAIFLATQAANVLRASVPPERAEDVYVYVGDAPSYFAGEPTVRDRPEFDELSRISLAAIPPGPRAVFVLREFDRVDADRLDPNLVPWFDSISTTVPGPVPVAPIPGEPVPSSPTAIAFATLFAALLLWVVGAGWSRWTFEDPVIAAAAAPGFGVATIAIVGLVLERAGVPLTGAWGPTLISALAGGLGYLLLILQGKAQAQPAPQVDEGPDH
jgi:hypothetical protein